MLSLAIVLLVILGGVNLMSYHKVVSDADAILAVLADRPVIHRDELVLFE